MLAFGWSFQDLMATSAYARRYCWDLLQARRQAEHDANQRASAEARRGH